MEEGLGQKTNNREAAGGEGAIWAPRVVWVLWGVWSSLPANLVMGGTPEGTLGYTEGSPSVPLLSARGCWGRGSGLGSWSDLVTGSGLGTLGCLEQNACSAGRGRDP